jgi:hypothetical protein
VSNIINFNKTKFKSSVAYQVKQTNFWYYEVKYVYSVHCFF